MMQLDDRAGHAARQVHSMFEFAPIPDPPKHRATTRRWILAGSVAAVTAVFGSGLYMASKNDATPSDETQAPDRHYGIRDLPSGWRRNVIPTAGADTNSARPVMTLIGTLRADVGINTTESDGSERVLPQGGEFVSVSRSSAGTAVDIDVYAFDSGRRTSDDEVVWEFYWQQDGLDAAASSVSRDAVLALLPGLIRQDDALVPSSNEFGVVKFRGTTNLHSAMFSPVLSAQPLPIDELTAYAPPSGQYGFTLSVMRSEPASNFDMQMLFDFVIETFGLTRTTVFDQGDPSYSGAFLDTGDPAGRLDLALRWADGHAIVASGYGFPEGEFGDMIQQIGEIDDGTWQQWVDDSDPPPPGVDIQGGGLTVETAAAVPPPTDAVPQETLEFFGDGSGHPLVTVTTRDDYVTVSQLAEDGSVNSSSRHRVSELAPGLHIFFEEELTAPDGTMAGWKLIGFAVAPIVAVNAELSDGTVVAGEVETIDDFTVFVVSISDRRLAAVERIVGLSAAGDELAEVRRDD